MSFLPVTVMPKVFLVACAGTQLAGKLEQSSNSLRKSNIQYCTTEAAFRSGYGWHPRVTFNHLEIKWQFLSYHKLSVSGKLFS